MSVWWAAFLGLVAGFFTAWFLAWLLNQGEAAALDLVNRHLKGIAGMLLATNTLLGGILGVLLFQALR